MTDVEAIEAIKTLSPVHYQAFMAMLRLHIKGVEGKRLKSPAEFRHAKRFTRIIDLANAAGVPRHWLQHAEKGLKNPGESRPEYLAQVAEQLGIEAGEYAESIVREWRINHGKA